MATESLALERGFFYQFVRTDKFPIHFVTNVGCTQRDQLICATAGKKAIVLVHGLNVSGRYMMPLAVALAPVAPVFVPDLPGYGLSSKTSLELKQLAEALYAWIKKLALPAVHLVGNSFGLPANHRARR